MKTKLPYISYPGCIPRILNKIKEAKTPERFTYDFLETKLGFKGGNYKQFVSLAKKIGLLNIDGTPTGLYKKLRNSKTSEHSIAQSIKIGYGELFERNEYANNLSTEDLKGLVVEITGLEQKDAVVKLICQTFNTLKKEADFEAKPPKEPSEPEDKPDKTKREMDEYDDFGLNLSYTINLVLPKTDDPAVFSAIFRSLRENLLRK
jgi:hypothetical protein